MLGAPPALMAMSGGGRLLSSARRGTVLCRLAARRDRHGNEQRRSQSKYISKSHFNTPFKYEH
jgi:hypothetical protein